ncbi:hypothetical protein KAR10_06520, partial [bacterium]|nr:hypothetical protein [bacterium]
MKKILRKISEFKSILVINVMALMCLSACINVYGNYTKPEELDLESREFLHEIAERTWKYLVFSTGEFGIPADHVILREDQKLHIADYTSVTNIGLFLMALPAAVDFGFLSPAEGDKW